MVVFPNCKINIGLQVMGKRADGFHNLESVFFPLQLKDALEAITIPGQETVVFTSSGLPVPGANEHNLCVKAYQLLKRDFPNLPGVNMHLHKVIPMGAGLGGGSADAAFALTMLNKLFHLQISREKLLNYALELGSDCPFFICNEPCFVTGRGETLTPISLDLSGYRLVVINPGIHINTGQAFAMLDLSPQKPSLRELIKQPIATWRNEITNDFEKPVFARHPEIAEIKNMLYQAGAIYASMSGSGSSVYGIFKQGEKPALQLPEHYFLSWT